MSLDRAQIFPAVLRLARLVYPAALAQHDGNEVQQHRLAKLNGETPLADYFRSVAVFVLSGEIVTARRARIFREQILQPVDAYEAIFEDARAVLERDPPKGIDWQVFKAAHSSARSLLNFHMADAPLQLIKLQEAISPGRMAPANDPAPPPTGQT